MLPSNSRPLRVAFTSMYSETWPAGAQYLKNLFIALKSLDSPWQPAISLLVLDQAKPDSYDSLIPYTDQLLIMPPDPLSLKVWQRLSVRMPKWLSVCIAPNHPLVSYLRKHPVDALFAPAKFGPRFSIPLLSWISDFQHLHLPEIFSPEQIRTRNQVFSQFIDYADLIILSSQCALRDFARFSPHSICKARVLSFVAQIPEHTYDSDPAWVCEYYHLPQRFFYLPNQFWKHKNHELVIEALSLVRVQHPDVTVVCTGSTYEGRDPLHFARLLTMISTRNLRNHLIILGMVPYDHVPQLMRQSLAVLQPSLFEGWSTTVEEAKSVGKRIILSDIPVHREQDPPQAVFFDPHDPEMLADCLVRALREQDHGPDCELEALARERLPKRTRVFGQTFVEIVREIVPG